MKEQVEYILSVRDQVSKKLRNLHGGFDKLGNKIDSTKRSADGLGSSIGGLVSIAALGFVTKQFFDLGLEMEKTEIKFGVLTGSLERGVKLMGELNEFSAITPFEPEALHKSAQTLLTFGVAADDILEQVGLIGDISGGSSEALQGVALALGQIQGNTRITGQDLLQLINRGFNPLLEISDATGISMKELRKSMEKGKISSDAVLFAFRRATSAGGRFHNMMEKMSKTGSGKLSTALGNIKLLLGEISQGFIQSPQAGGLLDFVNEMIVGLRDNKEGVTNAITGLGAGLGALLATVLTGAIVKGIIFSLGAVGASIAIPIATIIAVGVGTYLNSKEWQDQISGQFNIIKTLFGQGPSGDAAPLAMRLHAEYQLGQYSGDQNKRERQDVIAKDNAKEQIEILKKRHGEEDFKKRYDSGEFDKFDYIRKLRTNERWESLNNRLNNKEKTLGEGELTLEEQLKKIVDEITGASDGSTGKSSKSSKSHGFQAFGTGGDVTLTINKMVETINIISTDDDLDQLENKIKTLLIGAIQDATQQYR